MIGTVQIIQTVQLTYPAEPQRIVRRGREERQSSLGVPPAEERGLTANQHLLTLADASDHLVMVMVVGVGC